MNTRAKLSLGLDDEVTYADPDKGAEPKPYKIIDILTPNKKVEDLDSVLIISSEPGEAIEVFVAEIT